MVETKIKEHLSDNFIRILAANKGFMVDKPAEDYGADWTASRTTSYVLDLGEDKKSTRYLKDSRVIDFQLKATTENSIEIDPVAKVLKYDLEIKNYNDLIIRNNGTHISPLILILFVLPPDRNNWVDINDDELLLRKGAYWYMPPKDADIIHKIDTKKRVYIPLDQKLGKDCFDDFYTKFYS